MPCGKTKHSKLLPYYTRIMNLRTWLLSNWALLIGCIFSLKFIIVLAELCYLHTLYRVPYLYRLIWRILYLLIYLRHVLVRQVCTDTFPPDLKFPNFFTRASNPNFIDWAKTLRHYILDYLMYYILVTMAFNLYLG